MQGKQEVLERIDMLVDIYRELANDAVIDTDNIFCNAAEFAATLDGCIDDLLDLKQSVERITDDPNDI